MSASKRIEKLWLKITECKLKIKQLQEECEHPVKYVVKQHGNDTGNFCPSDDSHWLDLKCTLCSKEWRVYSEDKSPIGYTAMSNKYTAI